MVGADTFDNSASSPTPILDGGGALLYHGSVFGLNPSAAKNLYWEDEENAASTSNLRFSPAGDLDGDGFADFLVANSAYDTGYGENDGAVFVYQGSDSGISESYTFARFDGVIGVQSQFGTSITGAGDLNADGFDDIAVGAPLYENGEAA